ncbi:MAG: Lrp/AsnC family transcriptional regulator, partial [Candidatus Hodarchaeales archaeon]
LDELDKFILRELQKDCRAPLKEIAKKLEAKPSTVHYRVKRLEEQGFINGYSIKINPEKLNFNYPTIMQVRAKYGPKYYNKIGNQLKNIPGVWGVYFLLGEWDFIVLIRSKDRASYMKILDQVMEIEGIERTSSLVVAKILKENPTFEL